MTKQRASLQLFWCLFVVYTISNIGKTSFSAATAALIDEAVLTKTEAGLISGIFWLLYAIGQFAGGFVTNKLSPYTMINITIVGSAITNLLMAFAEDFHLMMLIWSISGIIQFGMWPGILKLISTEIIAVQRANVMGRLAFCYCLGSVLSYVFTAIILKVGSWKYIFMYCGFITAVSLLGSLYAEKRLSPILQEQETQARIPTSRKGTFSWDIIWKSELIFFCILMLIKSIVDVGIKNWMPTIMMETYGASPSYTSLLSVGLLLTNVLGVVLCAKIYDNTKCDELITLRILFSLIVPMVLLLLNFVNMNIYISTILMSGITVCVYGSGQILQMNYPGRFQVWGLTAAVGGIINCFAALGNVIATYGSGFIADRFGWNAMIIIWNVLIIMFVVLTILMKPTWKKFRRGE